MGGAILLFVVGFLIQAVITRAVSASWRKDRQLPFKANSGAGNKRCLVLYTGPVNRKARLKIIAAIEYDICFFNFFL